MALQIANPVVVAKVERLAALLAQSDCVSDRVDAFDPLEWSAGLPK